MDTGLSLSCLSNLTWGIVSSLGKQDPAPSNHWVSAKNRFSRGQCTEHHWYHTAKTLVYCPITLMLKCSSCAALWLPSAKWLLNHLLTPSDAQGLMERPGISPSPPVEYSQTQGRSWIKTVRNAEKSIFPPRVIFGLRSLCYAHFSPLPRVPLITRQLSSLLLNLLYILTHRNHVFQLHTHALLKTMSSFWSLLILQDRVQG